MSSSKNLRGRTEAGLPNPIDVHVGHRVRQRRMLMGLSQEKLAQAVGLTFQQVQKYERGGNRISASRLYDISTALDVDVSYFFDDMPEAVAMQSPRCIRAGFAEEPAQEIEPASPYLSRETLELARAFHKITDNEVRRKLLELVRAVGSE